LNYPTNSLKLTLINQSLNLSSYQLLKANPRKFYQENAHTPWSKLANMSKYIFFFLFFFIFDNPGYPDQLAQCPNISLNHTSCLSCYIIYTKKAIIPCIFWLGVWSHTWLWHILQKHILNKPWIIYCSSNLAIVRNPNINLQCIRSLINSLLV
jgi:hypothetical protein